MGGGWRQTAQAGFDLLRSDAAQLGKRFAMYGLRQPGTTGHRSNTARSLELGFDHDPIAQRHPQFRHVATDGIGGRNDNRGVFNLPDVAWMMEMLEDFFGVHWKDSCHWSVVGGQLPVVGIRDLLNLNFQLSTVNLSPQPAK